MAGQLAKRARGSLASGTPDVLYQSIWVAAPTVAASTAPFPALQYNETRTVASVRVPSNYYMTVDRWQLTGGYLPIFVPIIDTTQANPTVTPYVLALRYAYDGSAGGSATTFYQTATVTWEPQFASEPVPATSLGNQNLSSRYYHATNYTWFLGRLNTAMAGMITALNAALAGHGASLSLVYNPALALSQSGAGLEWVLDPAWPACTGVNGSTILTGGASVLTIGWNDAADLLLGGFATAQQPVSYAPILATTNINWLVPSPASPWIAPYNGYGPQALFYTDGSIAPGWVSAPIPSNNPVQLPPPVVVPQDYSTLDNWAAAGAILLDSSMPFEAEYTSPALPAGSTASNLGINTDATRNQQTALTDMTIPMTGGAGDWGQTITYFASSTPRWTVLTSPETLKDINIQLYWVHRNSNQRFPITLRPGGSFTAKLRFQRVDLTHLI